MENIDYEHCTVQVELHDIPRLIKGKRIELGKFRRPADAVEIKQAILFEDGICPETLMISDP
jgi:hypothetical protein